MGAQMVYLAKPETCKSAEDGGGDLAEGRLSYGLSAMQGWRRNMEDAHLAVTELDSHISLFGVFDGHGGRGVSRFAARKLPGIIREMEAYQQGNYVEALEKAFLAIDDQLREPAGRREVEALDRPDEGSTSHLMAVPKRLLQRFFGVRRGGGNGSAAEEGTARPAESEEQGREAPEEALDGDLRELEEEAATAPVMEVKAVPTEDGEDEELILEDDPDDFKELCENKEEAAKEDLANEPAAEAEEEDDGLIEHWAAHEEEMTLVDPARLTRDPTPEAQGCTAVVVLVVRSPEGDRPQIFCANAGDSRAVLSRGGQVVALSEDHKPESPGETARIKNAGGYVQDMPGGARVQGDLNLSRAMGDLRYKKPPNLPPAEQILTVFPEVRTFELTAEDEFMVLGCDGIWERMTNQEMVDFVRPRVIAEEAAAERRGLSWICSEICDQGLCPSMDCNENRDFDGTGCDNMTVMIVQLKRNIVDVNGRQAGKRPREGQDVAEPAAQVATTAEGDGGVKGETKRPRTEEPAQGEEPELEPAPGAGPVPGPVSAAPAASP